MVSHIAVNQPGPIISDLITIITDHIYTHKKGKLEYRGTTDSGTVVWLYTKSMSGLLLLFYNEYLEIRSAKNRINLTLRYSDPDFLDNVLETLGLLERKRYR